MRSPQPKLNALQIQDEFIETINAAFSRWSHAKRLPHETCGGHYGRTYSGAYRRAEKQLKRVGFTDAQIKGIIKDAKDMAELIRNAEEEQ